VGGVIGSGIMRAPGVVAQGVQDPLLMLAVWAVGGLAAMLAAMPLVEAGASVPKAGGTYAISYRALGPTLGVLNGWLTILQYVASNAFIAVVFGEYAHRLHLAEGVPVGALASFLIVGVAFINWIGTRVSGASQSVGSAVKGAAFLVLVAILFAAITSIAALVMAIRVIYQTYAGWDGAIYFSEEVQNPEHNVARSTFWGIALVTGLYVLANMAALHILPPSALAGSEFAVGDAAKLVMGPLADTFITAMGLFSLMAIVNLQVMAARHAGP
jgi:basic amino acid/polyamine antiporter, APA family